MCYSCCVSDISSRTDEISFSQNEVNDIKKQDIDIVSDVSDNNGIENSNDEELMPIYIPPTTASIEYSYSGRYGQELRDVLENAFTLYPSAIFVDSDFSRIGWVYEGYKFSDKEDIDSRFDEEAQLFDFGSSKLAATLYYGELTKLSDNIYSANGQFMPSRKKYENYISESVDFYVLVDEYKLTLITEDLTLEELDNYAITTYYVENNFQNTYDNY